MAEPKEQQLIIMVGNIGSGKSTIAKKLGRRGFVVVNMDSIQSMLSGGTYGLYDKSKRNLYSVTEKAIVESALSDGFSVVIDRTNMDKKTRQTYIDVGRSKSVPVVCYNFGKGCLSENLPRRMVDSRGVSTERWQKVFEFMQSKYEMPEIEEGFSSIQDMPVKFKFFAFDFDGCIVRNAFPAIGEVRESVCNFIKHLSENLGNYIIIWTCRNGEYLTQMEEFLNQEGIFFDAINENPIFNTGARKIFAHEYFDDRNSSIEETNYGTVK